MRVLLTLASSSMTGPAERLLGDAELLRAEGHEVTVACDTGPGNLVEIATGRGFPVASELRLSRRSGPLEMLRDVAALRRRLRAGVDLVHAHFSHDHHMVLLAARGLGPGLRIVRSLETEQSGSRWALRRSDGLEVPCQAVLAAPRLARFRREGRVVAIASAVDPARFSAGPSNRLREQLNLSATTPLVGIVARIKPERRHADLLAAFVQVGRVLPSAVLAIIGRGEGLPAIEAQVAALGLSGRVRFAGYWARDELVEAYRGLDVAVWLALGNDGGARGVLEAMAVGLPVVAYDLPPMSEQLGQGAGRLVPAGNVTALAEALADLLSDPAQRAALGAAARERVLERFTRARRSATLLSFYARVSELPKVR